MDLKQQQQQQSPLSPARVVDHKPTRLLAEAEAEESEAVVMDPVGGARYRECMRNHAASIGGLASDGCGEFMPAASPLSCAACGCHRSFHRRECVHHTRPRRRVAHSPPPTSILLYTPTTRWDHTNNHKNLTLSAPAPLQAHVSTNNHAISASEGRSETPEREEEMRSTSGTAAKRFRTKFTAEQKERMAEYAEKAGWRIHRQDDAALSAFCAEIGVKRNVLKVWMHNNKAAASAALRRTENAPPPPPTAVSAPAPPPPPQHAGV